MKGLSVLQPRRVLIVDDRRVVRRGLQALLALWPDVACVGEAADGQEGVKLVAEQRPDAVLMDIRMQGMDGLEATRRIKSQWPEVRVIVLTLRAEYEDEALAAGADVFLVKGGPPEALREAICKTSTRGDAGGEGRIQGPAVEQRGDMAGAVTILAILSSFPGSLASRWCGTATLDPLGQRRRNQATQSAAALT